jgi:hypothetical protein
LADISPPRPLSVSDAEGLVLLVNSAYRGDSGRQGWTTESDLLDGVRLTLQDAESLLAENLK